MHCQNQPQLTPPIGFDRLRESGFSEEDIQSIRSTFHRIHGTEEQGTDAIGKKTDVELIICGLFSFRELGTSSKFGRAVDR